VGSRVVRPGVAPRLVLDTGALIALERGDPRAFQHLMTAAQRGFLVVVPTLVVIEALEGARNPATVERILVKLDSEIPLLPAIAHQVAGLKKRSGVASTTDAVVVLEALAVPGSIILTGDIGDMHRLLDEAGARARVPVLRV
jgi:predicted nucleic acid-binding protein